jgi:hypothetical protein
MACPEPEPFVAAAAGEAEAAQERRFEEIGYGEIERQALGVETWRHRGEVYASVPPGTALAGPTRRLSRFYLALYLKE